MAANYPNFLSTATDMAYNIRLPNNLMSTLPPANMKLLGHHYFQGSIPVFNLNTPNEQHGIAFTKLDDKMKAPVNAVEGNHGAVAWLYLTTVQGTVGDFSSVYRVNTASGAPPATCENMPDHFEVQYAANYYFYGK